MISGDSTASHMGSVKNIEKARERRTFEVMPGSSASGIPEELQEHAQSVHPRMGYDMSDSLFMQQQQAAGRDKESKRALEEKTALEAFRAAALQKPFDPSAAAASGTGGEARAGGSSTGAVGVDSKRKEAPAPLAGIKLRKKTSRSGSSPSSAVSPGVVSSPGEGGRNGQEDNEEAATTAAGGKLSEETIGAGEGEGGGSAKKKHKKKKKKDSNKKKVGKDKKKQGSESGDGDGKSGAAAAEATAGLALGLVAYSSGEDDEDS